MVTYTRSAHKRCPELEGSIAELDGDIWIVVVVSWRLRERWMSAGAVDVCGSGGCLRERWMSAGAAGVCESGACWRLAERSEARLVGTLLPRRALRGAPIRARDERPSERSERGSEEAGGGEARGRGVCANECERRLDRACSVGAVRFSSVEAEARFVGFPNVVCCSDEASYSRSK